MSDGTPPLAPQFAQIDALAEVLRADAVIASIARVDINEWGPELSRGQPIIVIGFGDAEVTETMSVQSPGVAIDVPDMPGFQARALLDELTEYVVWVHAPVGGSAGIADAVRARSATDRLQRQVFRAVRRTLAGGFRAPPRVEWPGKDDPDVKAWPAYVYGSLARLRLSLASVILDNPYPVGRVTMLLTQAELSIDGGSTFEPIDPPFAQPVPPAEAEA